MFISFKNVIMYVFKESKLKKMPLRTFTKQCFPNVADNGFGFTF